MFDIKVNIRTEHAFWFLIGCLLAWYARQQARKEAATMESENASATDDIIASGNTLGMNIQSRIDSAETAAAIGRANRKDVTEDTIVRLTTPPKGKTS